jgi:hypothetical protein
VTYETGADVMRRLSRPQSQWMTVKRYVPKPNFRELVLLEMRDQLIASGHPTGYSRSHLKKLAMEEVRRRVADGVELRPL